MKSNGLREIGFLPDIVNGSGDLWKQLSLDIKSSNSRSRAWRVLEFANTFTNAFIHDLPTIVLPTHGVTGQ